MDLDDSFTRELEESSLMPFDGPANDEDILDLDLEVDQYGDYSEKKNNGGADQPQQPSNRFVSSVADDEARETSLRRELESVKRVNKLIATVNKSLQDAMGNMATVNHAVDNANFLLDKYSEILSQSTHTSRIILNGNWQGSTNDRIEMEEEAQTQALEAERRRRDEEEAAAAREREARARETMASQPQSQQRPGRGTRGAGTGRKTPGSRSASASGAYSNSYGKTSSTTGVSSSSSGTSSNTRGVQRGSGMARYAGRGQSGIGQSGIGRGTMGRTGRGTRGT
ncbi:hypothetical protein ABW20_dc0100410 [Dactylellina cionopaga]|nr:hypothetical protein ABW20_dc0100410 [Dactylellina cionopaga]